MDFTYMYYVVLKYCSRHILTLKSTVCLDFINF